MSRLVLALLGSAGVLTTALVAQAAERRIAVVGGDAELLRAISLALSAWNVETIHSAAPLPESSQPQAVLQATELCRRLGVDGVVWVSESSQGSVLWVYDGRTGDATTRVLSDSPPFESAAAAGVALSVKTALRASVEPAAAQRRAPIAPKSEAQPERATLEAGVDAHFIADNTAQTRVTLSSVVWLTSRRRFGVGLNVAGGPRININTASFAGHYRDVAFGPSAHLRLLADKTLAASLFVGAAAHASLLGGSVVGDSSGSSVKRYNASVDAGAQLDVRLGAGIYLGLGAQAAYLPAYQRYLVDGKPVLSLWPVTASAGGHCGVELF